MKPANREGTRHQVERIFDKIIGGISMGLITPPSVALVGWIVVMTVFIVARALFNVKWLFIEEFTIYLVVLGTFFGLPYALRKGAHIQIDVVTRILPRRVQTILAVVTSLLAVVILAYLTQKGWMWFLSGLESGRRSMFPSNVLQWPIYLFVPVGLGALTLGLLLEFYRRVISLVRGKS